MVILNPALPNRASTELIRTYFLQRATQSLQAMAGYIPLIATEAPVFLRPVDANFAACADTIMTVMYGETVTNCNPRMPYVVMLKILLDDYHQRKTEQASDKQMIYCAFVYVLQIILGSSVGNQRAADMTFKTVGVIEKVAKTMYGDLEVIMQNVRHGVEVHTFFENFGQLAARLNEMYVARRVMLLSNLLNLCTNESQQIAMAAQSFFSLTNGDYTVNYSKIAQTLCYSDDKLLMETGYLRSICIGFFTATA